MKKIFKKTRPLIQAVQGLALLSLATSCLSVFGQDSTSVESNDSGDPVGQSGDPVPATGPVTNSLPIRFLVGGSRQFNTGVDNGGNFSVNSFRTALGVPYRINDQYSVAAGLAYQLDSYNFGGGFQGWGDINTLTATIGLTYRYDQHWLIYGGPIVRTAAEGSDWSNATEGGGDVGFTYIASPDLRLGAGIVVIGQIEENAKVLPIITANWKFAEDWRFRLGFSDLGTAGYGGRVTWDFVPKWQWFFDFHSQTSRFRIEGSGITTDGVGQESSINLTTGPTWSPCAAFSASAFVGVAEGGKVAVDTSSGHQIRNDSYNAAPILGLRANFTF